MDFIYTDEIHGALRPKQAGELLKLAKEYQLARLVDICEAAIVSQAELADVGWVLALCSEHHRESRLQRHFFGLAARELREVQRYQAFQELPQDALTGLQASIEALPVRLETVSNHRETKQGWGEFGRYLMWRLPLTAL